MNARYVTAWGIDLTTTTKGRVVKSIWRPSSRHSGQVGLEARNFVFLPGQDKKCIADDGGIIEVKVFRARDRRSLAPKLEEFRFQENYGIAYVYHLVPHTTLHPLTNIDPRALVW